MSYECMMNCGNACHASNCITENKWKTIQDKCNKWIGLDRYGDIYETTAWQNGPQGYYICNNCYITLSSSRMLEQAEKRKENEERVVAENEGNVKDDDIPLQPPSPKRLRSSVGILHYPKTKCVWCMKGSDKKHPNRKTGKLYRLETHSAWRAFQRHTVLIEDEAMRLRIERLAESTSLLADPFANDIMYHQRCWLEHVTNNVFKEENAAHLQNVTYFEMKNLFLRYVDSIIFSEHEIRSLQSVLQEYNRLAFDYGFSVGDVKSSYIKEILTKEYGENIGFKERCEKNKSELVYDVKGGRDYIEVAMTSLGISDDQLLENFAKRLSTNIKQGTPPTWPPPIDYLEQEEDVSGLLSKHLSSLRKHKKVKTNSMTVLYFIRWPL